MIETIINALKFVAAPHRGENRRLHQRTSYRVPLLIQPLDDDYCEQGEPFWTMSRDFSRKGIGFNWSHPVLSSFVHISIPDHGFSGIAEVRHNTPKSGSDGLFVVGAEFLDECNIRPGQTAQKSR